MNIRSWGSTTIPLTGNGGSYATTGGGNPGGVAMVTAGGGTSVDAITPRASLSAESDDTADALLQLFRHLLIVRMNPEDGSGCKGTRLLERVPIRRLDVNTTMGA